MNKHARFLLFIMGTTENKNKKTATLPLIIIITIWYYNVVRYHQSSGLKKEDEAGRNCERNPSIPFLTFAKACVCIGKRFWQKKKTTTGHESITNVFRYQK